MFRQWALLVDGTGNLIAVNCFAADPLAKPDWVMEGQANLVSLTASSDESYLLAVYQSSTTSLAKWDVIL